MQFKIQALEVPIGKSSLAALLHHPKNQLRAAAIVAHGQNSSMASQKLSRLAQAFAGAGVLALQFDHTGCGQSLGELELTTLTGRKAEFLAAVRFVQARSPGLPLIYMGSSLGGTVALLAADQVPPAATVCWSAPTDLAGLVERLDQPPEGFSALINDIPKHDLPGVLRRSASVLFVHGELDEVVPVEQAIMGHQLAGEPKAKMIIPGADHRISRLGDQLEATARTLDWVDGRLSDSS